MNHVPTKCQALTFTFTLSFNFEDKPVSHCNDYPLINVKLRCGRAWAPLACAACSTKAIGFLLLWPPGFAPAIPSAWTLAMGPGHLPLTVNSALLLETFLTPTGSDFPC